MAQKKKKKKFNPALQKFNLTKYIKEAARKLPFYECLVLSLNGLDTILVSRKRQNGEILFCYYLVDTYCLGVKNVNYKLSNEDDYEELKESYFHGEANVLDVTLAHNIIYGAVEYAEDLGFEPHKDFMIAEYILDPVESVSYIDVEFGHNGKVHYISGPNDNPSKIIKQLEKTLGVGNFIFTLMDEGVEFDDDYDDDDYDDDDYDDDDDDDDEEFDEYEEVK